MFYLTTLTNTSAHDCSLVALRSVPICAHIRLGLLGLLLWRAVSPHLIPLAHWTKQQLTLTSFLQWEISGCLSVTAQIASEGNMTPDCTCTFTGAMQWLVSQLRMMVNKWWINYFPSIYLFEQHNHQSWSSINIKIRLWFRDVHSHRGIEHTCTFIHWWSGSS